MSASSTLVWLAWMQDMEEGFQQRHDAALTPTEQRSIQSHQTRLDRLVDMWHSAKASVDPSFEYFTGDRQMRMQRGDAVWFESESGESGPTNTTGNAFERGGVVLGELDGEICILTLERVFSNSIEPAYMFTVHTMTEYRSLHKVRLSRVIASSAATASDGWDIATVLSQIRGPFLVEDRMLGCPVFSDSPDPDSEQSLRTGWLNWLRQGMWSMK